VADRERVDQLLALLAQYVRTLRGLSRTPVEDFRTEPRDFGSAERFLQLAIETTLNVGHHIIASAGFEQPGSYADIFRVLGKEGVLEPEFAAALEPMARMRNRLVHLYEDVDPERVHELLRTRLGDFDEFAAAIARYLDRS
jgi:uncharacterized protein YutE (UPF0331/DUF86 family)